MNGKLVVSLYTDGCKGTNSYVRYLEHVQARITLTADRRGEIEIYLTSPRNTKSTLLAKRARDVSREGFNNWAFMTTHNWGEEAEGTWFLQIENGASSCECSNIKINKTVFFFSFLFFILFSFVVWRIPESFIFHLECLWHELYRYHFIFCINIWFVWKYMDWIFDFVFVKDNLNF